MQDAVAHVKVDSSLHDYALEIVNRTRKSEQLASASAPAARSCSSAPRKPVPTSLAAIIASPTTSNSSPFPFSHTALSPVRATASLQKKSETTDSVLRDIVESVPRSLVIAPL